MDSTLQPLPAREAEGAESTCAESQSELGALPDELLLLVCCQLGEKRWALVGFAEIVARKYAAHADPQRRLKLGIFGALSCLADMAHLAAAAKRFRFLASLHCLVWRVEGEGAARAEALMTMTLRGVSDGGQCLWKAGRPAGYLLAAGGELVAGFHAGLPWARLPVFEGRAFDRPPGCDCLADPDELAAQLSEGLYRGPLADVLEKALALRARGYVVLPGRRVPAVAYALPATLELAAAGREVQSCPPWRPSGPPPRGVAHDMACASGPRGRAGGPSAL